MTAPKAVVVRDAPVRWREDTGWEMRCSSCAIKRRQRFWPLTHEFWNYRLGMKACRACVMERAAAKKRERYYASEEYREDRKRKAREYRAEMGATVKIIDQKRWQAFLERRANASEDELQTLREKAAERQRRYRARRRERAA